MKIVGRYLLLSLLFWSHRLFLWEHKCSTPASQQVEDIYLEISAFSRTLDGFTCWKFPRVNGDQGCTHVSLESNKFDVVGFIMAEMDANMDVAESKQKITSKVSKSANSDAGEAVEKREGTSEHVDGLRDKVTTPRGEQPSPPTLDALMNTIASLTKSLKTVRENQDDMVSCMMAAGAKPYPGKGKGVGKRSLPRDDSASRPPVVKHTSKRVPAPPVSKRARRESTDMNYRDSDLDYSGDDNDSEDDEIAFTSDDIENQIDAFLQSAQTAGPPAKKLPPLLPLSTPSTSGSQATRGRAPTDGEDHMEEVMDESLALFAQDLTTDEDMGPDVNRQLAEIMTNLLGKKMSDEKVKAKIEEYPPPRNVPLLHPPRVNEEIWELMKAGPRSSDIRMRKIQVRLTRGLVALARLAEVLLLNKKRGANPDLGDCLNVALQAFALIGNANYELSLRRRETLRSQLNPKYSRLCYPSTPVTSDLFGDDVSKLVEDITKVNKIGANISQNQYQNRGYNNNNNNNNRYGQGRGGKRNQGSYRGKGRADNKQSKNGKGRGNGRNKNQ